MLLDQLFSSLERLQLYLVAGAFALARFGSLIAIMPLFSRSRLVGLLRNGVALAFALPVLPLIVASLERSGATGPAMVALIFKEAIVGLTLGFLLGITFWAAEAAGNIVDLQRGSTMATLIDPMMTHETSATGTLLAIIMVAVFLVAGGLELMLTALYASYEVWPVDRLIPVFSPEAAGIFLDLLTRVVLMALTLAFPLILSQLLSDLILAFLTRASPHLNIFALSLVVKTFAFSFVFVLYATYLVTYMERDIAFLRGIGEQIEALGCRNCL